MDFYFSALILAFGFTALGFGILISMRIFNIPDITTDGSYTLGAVAGSLVILHNYSPFLSLVIAFVTGAIAGALTGLIHTRLKVNALLSGILVMTSLYSVNLFLLGRSNLPLIGLGNIYSVFNVNTGSPIQMMLILITISLLLWALLSWLLNTDFGIAIRATGTSESMVRANGVNPNKMKVIGLALANGLVAFSGALIAQYQGFVDINMGIGIIITGLGSVIIGEALVHIFRTQKIVFRLLGVISGCLIFRLILAFVLDAGIDPVFLKMLTSVIVLVVVMIPGILKKKIT